MADQGWVLWYWGATFKGRGEYVRLIFEAAGVPYTENNDGADIMSHCDMQGHKGKGFVFLVNIHFSLHEWVGGPRRVSHC